MHSTALAPASACEARPPHASADATARIGRKRLPPAKRLYRIALWMTEGLVEAGGRNRLSAWSTRSLFRLMYSFNETLMLFPAVVSWFTEAKRPRQDSFFCRPFGIDRKPSMKTRHKHKIPVRERRFGAPKVPC